MKVLRAVLVLALILPAVFQTNTGYAQTAQENTASAFQEGLSVEDHFDFANGLYRRQMYEMALPEFETLLQKYPDHPRIGDARFRIAESFFFLERYEDALKAYRDLLDLFPAYGERGLVKLHSGEALYRLGRFEDALKEMQEALESQDKELSAAARYYSGKMLFDKQDWEGAKGHFREIYQSAGETNFDAHVGYFLGEIALEQGLLDEAGRYFQTNLESENPLLRQLANVGSARANFQKGSFEAAASHFKNAFSIESNHMLRQDAFLNYLRSLFNLERFEEVRQISGQNPPVELSSEKKVDIQFLSAASAVRQKDFQAALSAYDAVLGFPDIEQEIIEQAELGKVEAFLNLEQVDKALPLVNKWNIDTAKDRERMAYLQGEAWKIAGEHTKAISSFDFLMKEFPDSPYYSLVLLSRGYVLIESGKEADAVAALQSFYERFSDHPTAGKVLSDIVLLNSRLQSWDAAVAAAILYLEKFPEGDAADEVLYRLASIYTELKKYDLAQATYDRYLSEFGKLNLQPDIYFFMGFNQQEAGQLSKAADFYQKVDEGKVSDQIYKSTLQNMGFCYINLEQWAEAAETYRRMITSFPQNEISPEVHYWLADYYLKKAKPEVVRDVIENLKIKGTDNVSVAQVEYYLAESHRLDASFKQAVLHYRNCIAQEDVFQADAFLGLALSLREMKDFEKAEKAFEDAIRVAADDYRLAIQARMELAETLVLKGDFAQAAKGFFSVAILYEEPQWVPAALFKAGENFEKVNDIASAKQAYQELLKRYPENSLSVKARARQDEIAS